jgi:hypothetical protein
MLKMIYRFYKMNDLTNIEIIITVLFIVPEYMIQLLPPIFSYKRKDTFSFMYNEHEIIVDTEAVKMCGIGSLVYYIPCSIVMKNDNNDIGIFVNTKMFNNMLNTIIFPAFIEHEIGHIVSGHMHTAPTMGNVCLGIYHEYDADIYASNKVGVDNVIKSLKYIRRRLLLHCAISSCFIITKRINKLRKGLT